MLDPVLSRRSLLKAALSLAGAGCVTPDLASAIHRAFKIDPEPGSTLFDAEHVVFLMQENRSFDHAFGTLQGVRGFNDPRTIDLPGGRPVWLQANKQGEVFTPFRLDIQHSKATWMNGLPHTWPDQVDARNHGTFDQWLAVKHPVGGKQFAHLPLTLGYHTRADIPFYYALADAFTICDQNFCSSLTGTIPNRLFFWTGTNRPAQTADSIPHLYNGDSMHIGTLGWTTFPERLTDAGISWRFYQNELSVESGLAGQEQDWLGNFGTNPLEYFKQYNAKFAPSHVSYLALLAGQLPAEIATAQAAAAAAPADTIVARKLQELQLRLKQVTEDLVTWHPDRFAQLPERNRALHQQALCTNRAHEDYRQLTTFSALGADGKQADFPVPKGDLFHQFRDDVANGRLPAVSWLSAPQRFSDHPSAPWFGAWYVSEALNILTSNPAVWKKTIFILTYDENDGFFDHCPPFVAPRAGHPETGGCSSGIDASLEFTTRDRASPIGLGYRVPLIVASPWSRGGWVNSEVFDHTSSIRFLETFLSRKSGKKIREGNISSWRRAVTGDLTSAFRSWNGEAIALPDYVDREKWLTVINNARNQPPPDPGEPLSADDIETIRRDPSASRRMPRQEPGTRPACALPYELAADGVLGGGRNSVLVSFKAGTRIFGDASAGSAFQVYAPGRVAASEQPADGKKTWDAVRTWNFAVAAGEALTAEWPLADFDGGSYQLRVYGPNGFFRELIGSDADPAVSISVETEVSAAGDATGNLGVTLQNTSSSRACTVTLSPHAYGHQAMSRNLAPGTTATVAIPLQASFGWYDLTVSTEGSSVFSRRYAGRAETGRALRTDSLMGGKP